MAAEEVLQAAKLLIDEDMDDVFETGLAHGRVAAISRRSPRKRGPSEDTALLLPVGEDVALIAIADGLGGAPSGDQAACWVLEELRERVLERYGETSMDEVIIDAIERADRRLHRVGIGAATTVAVLEIRGHTARPYHVGDSEVLIVGQRGRIRFRSVPHSPVGRAVAAGEIDEDDALFHDARHVISNAVGVDGMFVDVGDEIELAANDTVLLMTDGLSDNLREKEIVEIVRKGALRDSLRELADLSSLRMSREQGDDPSKPDDLTGVAFRLH